MSEQHHRAANGMHSETETQHSALAKYVSGFALSVVLTLLAYFAVTDRALRHNWLIGTILGLALVQFMVQLVFFLHLGPGRNQRLKRVAFFFMIGVVCIVVFGSLWIMSNLNYRMTPQQVNSYLNSQDGL